MTISIGKTIHVRTPGNKKFANYKSVSVNKKVAAKAGKVKARKKGSCYVYAYAQNGIAKKVKVKVNNLTGG